MRILMLTQWFDPEPTSKGLAFAAALRFRGHVLDVVTGIPNYPDGRVYPDYRVRLWQRERLDGVRVTRVALYPSHDRTGWRRALNYGSFAATSIALAPVLVRRPDVIYVYHPPLTVGLAGVAIASLLRAPFILDVQDLWPDTLTATGMVRGRWLLWAVDRLASFVYGRAARVVVQSHGFAAALRDRGVPQEKLEVIYNWADEDALQSDQGDAARLDAATFNVVFAGTMGRAQSLETVLRAAETVQGSDPTGRFVFVGGGVERAELEAKARDRQLTNVRFLPRMPMDEVGSVLRAADVLLVHLRDDPLFAITIPSKTQAYLAVGRPVLMAVRGEAAELIERSHAGVVCPPEDPQALADAVSRLARLPADELEAMGRAGRAFYDAELAMQVGVDRFEEVLMEVASAARGGSRRR